MTRNERDLVLRAAFGDLEPHEEPKFQQLLQRDPEAQAEYRSLQGVRGELGHLREAPECQVSVERLRDALLKESMRANAKPRISWLQALSPAMGIAALALAWVVVQRPGADAVVDLAPTSEPRTVGAQALIATPQPEQQVAVQTAEATPPAQDRRLPLSQVNRPEPATPISRPAPSPPSLHASYTSAPVVTLASVSASPAAFAAPVEPQTPVVVEKSAQPVQPVVIVTGQESAETGARVATEADHNNHVVFGG